MVEIVGQIDILLYINIMKYYNKSIKIFSISLIFLLLVASCNKTDEISKKSKESQSKLLLGTSCKISIYDYPSEKAFKQSFKRIEDIEDKMSIRISSSEVSMINKNAGIKPVVVSKDTFKVVKKAIENAKLSDGAFDPTVGPLVSAWDIGFDDARVPLQEEIDSLLPLIGYNMITLNEENQSVYLQKKGIMLDLGGIAKGYAADEVAKILKSFNSEKAIINLGGNILTIGLRVNETKWRIGIQKPQSDRGEYVMIVNLEDLALVTSGPYERFFISDDVLYHHILDTKTGYPVKTNLTSVSIIANNSFIADALSTAVYSLGLEKGLSLINSLDKVEAIFIDNLNNIYLSKGFEDNSITYVLSDESFKVIEP